MTKLSPEAVADIVARRERGQGYGYIAAIYGVSPGAVQYHCWKLGAVSPRQRMRPVPKVASVHKRGVRPFTEAEDQRLLDLSRRGKKYKEICQVLDRPITSVRMRLYYLAMCEDMAECQGGAA